ncbi:MAG: methyltransferase domain-containing protein [Acidobacteria bacterium]|nr:methyltransferase domain-containing protein [Acidobacteriota bacterium]
MQNKSQEKLFFDEFSSAREYDVFTTHGYKTILGEYLRSVHTPAHRRIRVIDLGCGTGAFTRQFRWIFNDLNDYTGLDFSMQSLRLAAKISPGIRFCAGNIENCCFKDNVFDVVLFSGVLHHFEETEPCMREAYRILRNGGCVLSYDPNIKNPIMWLYRHPSSPFFSKKRITKNEHLLYPEQIASTMEKVGFVNVSTHCKSGVTFKYAASKFGRLMLPFYNIFETLLGLTSLESKYGSFIIGYGEKRKNDE